MKVLVVFLFLLTAGCDTTTTEPRTDAGVESDAEFVGC